MASLEERKQMSLVPLLLYVMILNQVFVYMLVSVVHIILICFPSYLYRRLYFTQEADAT